MGCADKATAPGLRDTRTGDISFQGSWWHVNLLHKPVMLCKSQSSLMTQTRAFKECVAFLHFHKPSLVQGMINTL